MFRFTTIASLSTFLLAQAAGAQPTTYNVLVGHPNFAPTCTDESPTGASCSGSFQPNCGNIAPGTVTGIGSGVASPAFLAANVHNEKWGDWYCGADIRGSASKTVQVTFIGPGPSVSVRPMLDYRAVCSFTRGAFHTSYAAIWPNWSLRLGPDNSEVGWFQFAETDHPESNPNFPWGFSIVQQSTGVTIASIGQNQWAISGRYRAPARVVPTNVPVPISDYRIYVQALPYCNSQVYLNTDITARGWVPAEGPVFELPPGYSANSTDLNVVDNQYMGAAPYPAIASQPSDAFPCLDATATFTVAATASGTPTYQWRKGGVALVNGGRISGADSTTLSIANVEASDVGSYDCRVTNDFGTATSDPAMLTIGVCPIVVTAATPQTYLDGLATAPMGLVMENVPDRPTLLLPALTSVGGVFGVVGNATLATLGADLLNNVTGNATISDNPLLGSVVLPGLTQLGGGLTVVNNTSATTIDFSALGGVGEGVTVTDNPGATTIDFSALGGVGEGVTVTDNPGATTIDFSALGGVGEGVTVTDNPGATTIDFSALGGVGESVTVRNNPGATSVHLAGLSNVDGSVTISNHPLLGSVALPSLTQVGGGLTVVNNTAATTIDFSSLGGVGGDVTVTENPGASTIDFSALGGVGGDVTVTENPGASTIDFSALGGVGGDVTVTENPGATDISLDSLTDVGGDLTLETQGQADVDLSAVDVAGDTDVSSTGATSVEVQTPGGTTSVEMCNDAACMDADLPDDAAPAGTPLAILHVDALAPVPGQDASGDPAVVDPVAAYAFTLGAPLQGAASLVFDLTLASLSPAEQTAVLDAYVNGQLTLTVKSDAPGSVPQARAQCGPADPLVADGCVKVGAFDALGFQLPSGETAGAATLRIAALVSHFSTYAMAIVTPLGAGDCNCSGAVTLDDVPAFVLALLDTDAYAAQYPGCPIGLANANADGAVDGLDVQSFVNMLVAP